MKKFIFDLQRFATYFGEITVTDEGFKSGMEIKSSGQYLVSITTSKDAGGSVTVINDYNFAVDGHKIKIANVAAESAVTFAYGEDGTTSLDLGELGAQAGKTIYVASAGNVDKLIPPATWGVTGSIKIGSKTYKYVSGGSAYFNLENNAVKSFTLGDVGDSITVGKNQTVDVYDSDDATNKLIDVASGANYTVTKTDLNYTVALTESANLTIGGTNLNFEISKATKAALASNPIVITFENDGTIASVDGLYNLTSSDDKLTVSGEDVSTKYGGLPVINSSGDLEYISVSDGNFTLTGGTQGKQTIEVSHSATVYNSLDNITLIDRNVITNSNGNILVNGTSDNDTITNSASKVTINAGTGDDLINLGSNASSNVIEYTQGDGNDTIEGFNSTSTLKIGGGTGTYSTLVSDSDIIVSVGDGKITLAGAASLPKVNIKGVNPLLIVGTNKAENIPNDLDDATIDALGGNDTIANTGANVTIDGGKGNDSISNEGAAVTISGGDWADTIQNSSGGANSSIDGGAGNDLISNSGDDVTLLGGAGNDSISNFGSNVTLNGGKGNDTLSLNYANLIEYKSGDGNDLIQGFNEDDTLSISGGSYSTQEKGSDVLVKVGKGTITLKDARVTTDTISINGKTIKLKKNITLTNGNDSFENSRSKVSINGSKGNDSISNSGSNVTIGGGAGDDLISLGSDASSNVINYKSGDGNDTIEGFNSTSTLKIGGGTGTYFAETVGSDIIVTVGEGKITLAGAASLPKVNIKGTYVNPLLIVGTNKAENIPNDLDDATIRALGGNDTITNTGTNVSIDGGKGNDSISNEGSNVSIDGSAGNDSISNSGNDSAIVAGDGNNTIDNSGGYSSIYRYEYVEAGEGTEWKSEELSYSGSNVSINAGKGNDFIRNSGNDSAIVAGDGNDIIENSGGYTSSHSYEYGRESGEAMERKSEELSYSGSNVTIDAGKGDDSISNSGNNVLLGGGAGNDTIENSGGYSYSRSDTGEEDDFSIYVSESYSGSNVTIDAGKGNDFIRNSGSNVTISGGAGNDHISLGAVGNLIEYASGDGKDTILGFNESDTLTISGGS